MDKPHALVESVRNSGPNVYALVHLPGGPFCFRWVDGRLVYRPLARTQKAGH